MNNAEIGMTLQALICEIYNIKPNDYARRQFVSNFNPKYKNEFNEIINKIFNYINLKPVECTTFKYNQNSKEKFIPHNFILENGKTLSIRTSKKNDKIAPRVIGQAGFKTLNSFFSDIFKKNIENKNDIKLLIYNYIPEVLPTFFDYLLNSDYNVWIYQEKENFNFIVLPGDICLDIDYNINNFTFTSSIENWNESITLKYKNISIAEIQIHKNRTFKFRFIMKNLINLLQETNRTNETMGITAEKAICDLFSLNYPDNFKNRSSSVLQIEMEKCIKKAFTNLPKPIKYTGSLKGSITKNSKCPYDFILEGNKKLSVKTNFGKYVCPPEVGQPSDRTCYIHFKHLIRENYIDEKIFKTMVLNKIEFMLPIYLKHLFESDYLLWIYKDKQFSFKIFNKNYGVDYKWDKSKFSFSNKTVEEWNECNSLQYDNISIGQFQVHKNRNSFKFRFNFPNLIKLLSKNQNISN